MRTLELKCLSGQHAANKATQKPWTVSKDEKDNQENVPLRSRPYGRKKEDKNTAIFVLFLELCLFLKHNPLGIPDMPNAS